MPIPKPDQLAHTVDPKVRDYINSVMAHELGPIRAAVAKLTQQHTDLSHALQILIDNTEGAIRRFELRLQEPRVMPQGRNRGPNQ